MWIQNLLKLFIIVVFSKNFYTECVESDDVTYYENLITTEIEKFYQYETPTSAEEFRPKPSSTVKKFGSYDFIIVGSGPGGSVVANRLSEINKWKVLLLEAGGPETNFSIIPAMHVFLYHSHFNWGFLSTEQSKACLGIVDKRCPIPRGKSLGGSTAINYSLYTRGNRVDYDRWAAEGNPGWSYSEVLPYFIKSEDSHIDGDPGYHGRDGYRSVQYTRPNDERIQTFLEASRFVQNSSTPDYNGKEQLGAFTLQINNIKQFRQSSASAFLKPIEYRKNLKIITRAYVTKITTDSLSKTATGVEFTLDGQIYTAKARKEVILSAGAINSPYILMHSGIGPRDHLENLNIPVIQDLPVGKTLFDHGIFCGAFVSINASVPEQTLREQIEDFLNGFGSLTIPGNTQGIEFHKTKFETNRLYPDIEILAGIPGAPDWFVSEILNVTKETYDAVLDATQFKIILNTFFYALRPKSTGKITLQSKDPFKYPFIDLNLLDNDYDVEVMYAGVEILKKILKTKLMKKLNASLIIIDYPQCRDYELGSKDYWICAFRLLTTTSHHQSSTCKMGPSPLNSVVDNRGKVHGVKKLRVVDVSVIPLPLAGHTSAPTFMLAEKISDYIKLDYGLPIKPINNTIY